MIVGPPFSRANPSPRYRELLKLYRQMHAEGEKQLGIPAEQTFDGRSLLPHGEAVRALARHHQARSILDYGSGKGHQYGALRIDLPNGESYADMAAFWGVERISCYDPGYAPFSTLPEGPFDGVVCTDVLEHCPEEDVGWIVEEMFGLADRFLFANIASYPAMKRLPNGENAHITVRPAAWWKSVFDTAAARRPAVRYYGVVDVPDGSGRIAAERFGG